MNWRDAAPLAGLGILAITGLYYLLRPKREDPGEIERQRRAYLNRVGRIVEGQVLDVVDNAASSQSGSADGALSPLFTSSREEKYGSLPGKGHAAGCTGGASRLLHYTYSISGVTYETAQDITGLEERIHLTRVAAGQTASVKYDPSNPSNSILLADDWSGLH